MPHPRVPHLEVDLSDRARFRQGMPWETLEEIRSGAALWWHPPTEGTREILETGFYVVPRHADLVAVSRDPERFSSRDGTGLRKMAEVPSISSLDPPEQTRWRRLIGRSFTPGTVRRLEERMQEWTDAILEDVLPRGECDFVQQVSHLLPLHVIADIVGIPTEERAEVFARVNDMVRHEDPDQALPEGTFEDAKAKLARYAWGLTRKRRAAPNDDVWSHLIRAELELEDGSRTAFDDDELGIWFMTLAIAGSETTRNVLAVGLEALIRHPEQLKRLREDPTLMPLAVEEILRWSSPVLYQRRTTTCEVEIAGHPVEAGMPVMLMWPAGNRDPEAFDDPWRFDITRNPNEHVAFGGGGPHFCLGANLARKEMSVMLGAVVERMDEIELAGPSKWTTPGIATPVAVGIDELPIRFKMRP